MCLRSVEWWVEERWLCLRLSFSLWFYLHWVFSLKEKKTKTLLIWLTEVLPLLSFPFLWWLIWTEYILQMSTTKHLQFLSCELKKNLLSNSWYTVLYCVLWILYPYPINPLRSLWGVSPLGCTRLIDGKNIHYLLVISIATISPSLSFALYFQLHYFFPWGSWPCIHPSG